MIEVDLRTLYRREPAQVFVIRIVLEESDAIRPDPIQDRLCDGGFSRA